MKLEKIFSIKIANEIVQSDSTPSCTLLSNGEELDTEVNLKPLLDGSYYAFAEVDNSSGRYFMRIKAQKNNLLLTKTIELESIQTQEPSRNSLVNLPKGLMIQAWS